MIYFFDDADIQALLTRFMSTGNIVGSGSMNENNLAQITDATPLDVIEFPVKSLDDRAPAEVVEEENTQDLYSMKNFEI
jgi:hypothetical protein